mgnify:CR=1 FL=1
MALRFSNTADIKIEVVITSDESVTCNTEQAQAYLTARPDHPIRSTHP